MTLTIPDGLLVAIDGIDGAGKTTLARALRSELEAVGVAVTQSKEPTSGQWGTLLRASAAEGRLTVQEELRLLLLDRRQHVDEVIRPALDRGEVVILDRYFPSTVAYQGAAGIDVGELLDANDFAPTPDLLLVLDVEPSIGLDRIRARGDKPNHFETHENLERCRLIFQALKLPNQHVLDGSETADAVQAKAHALVLRAVADKFRRTLGVTPDGVEAVRQFLPSLV